ncbi:MAG: hypothetical protein J7480_03305 [Microbacteriaceae bacterium]|nr:hypothetical protein [Microbacteriaceae bacterium]
MKRGTSMSRRNKIIAWVSAAGAVALVIVIVVTSVVSAQQRAAEEAAAALAAEQLEYDRAVEAYDSAAAACEKQNAALDATIETARATAAGADPAVLADPAVIEALVAKIAETEDTELCDAPAMESERAAIKEQADSIRAASSELGRVITALQTASDAIAKSAEDKRQAEAQAAYEAEQARRLRGSQLTASWSTTDGYSYEVAVSDAFVVPAIDVASAKPGDAMVGAALRYTIALKNTTPGHEAPGASVIVHFAYPIDSPVCAYFTRTAARLDYQDQEGNWCLVGLQPWGDDPASINITRDVPVNGSIGGSAAWSATDLDFAVPEDQSQMVADAVKTPTKLVLRITYRDPSGRKTGVDACSDGVACVETWAAS